MGKSRHMHQRMNQRGITERMLQVVEDFGIALGDKLVLDCSNIDLLMREMDRLRKDLLKIRDKGGLVAVEVSGCKITAYRTNSFDRKANKRKRA